MNEFRPNFHGDIAEARHHFMVGEYSPANAITRFDNGDAQACRRQHATRSQTRSAGADDQDVVAIQVASEVGDIKRSNAPGSMGLVRW